MDWLPLTLFCAFSLATTDAMTKAWLGGYRARELALIRLGLTGLALAPWLPEFDLLSRQPAAFWYWVMAMLPLELAAMVLYMRAIRDHPLALTLPYLAFTPVFVILTGFLLLGETINWRGGLGILLVVTGAWLLNLKLEPQRGGSRQPADAGNRGLWAWCAFWSGWRAWIRPLAAILDHPGSRAMLLVAFLFSLTAVMGKGAMRYLPPETFGAFYYTLLGLASLALFALPAPRTLARLWRRPWAVLVVAGANALMVYTHFLALARVEVAYMIAVKRTSLLFGILYGALWFHESGLGRHLAAGGLMLGGIYFIAT